MCRPIRPLLPTYRISGYCRICGRTENVQIRLHAFACASGLSLFAYGIRTYFPICASFMIHNKQKDTLSDQPAYYVCYKDYTLHLGLTDAQVMYNSGKGTVCHMMCNTQKGPLCSLENVVPDMPAHPCSLI